MMKQNKTNFSCSVAIAAYKGEKYLKEQLESLFAQTRLPDEIVICDDSPDDAIKKIVETLAASSPCKIHYHHNHTQCGLNGNFSKAVSLCRGNIIFFCDQDDVWLSKKIELMLEVLYKNPEIGAVFCDSTVVDENLKSLGYSLWDMCGFILSRQKKLMNGKALDIFLKRAIATGHNIAFRAEYKKILLPFISPLAYDISVCILLACVTKWGMLDEELTLYRIHDNNLSNTSQHSIAQQLELSRASIKNNKFKTNVDFFKAILDRLEQSDYDISLETSNKLRQKIKHFLKRANLSSNIFYRMPLIINETFNGNYFSYANGWKSILVDIFLRKK
jgi:glycosyltransferase involved in cell wall biosynthesis